MALFRTRRRSYTIRVIANNDHRDGGARTILELTVEKGHFLPGERGAVDHDIGRTIATAIKRNERLRGNDGHPTLTDEDKAAIRGEEIQA